MKLSHLPRALALAPIAFYQYCISPLFPGCCRFYPCCSAYARQAILSHGLFRGGALALYRLLRCQPLGKGGFDPVPTPKHQISRNN